MNTPKRHHIVPTFYLRRFGVRDEVRLAKREDLGTTIPTDVINATVQKHFYALDTEDGRSPEIEAFFANTVEPLGVRAISRIVDQGFFPPAPGLRDQMSTFCAFQLVRGEAFRSVIRDDFEAVAKRIGALVTPEAARKHLTAADGTAPSDEAVRDFVAFARNTQGYQVRASSEANLHLSAMMEVVLDLVPYFAMRRWQLLSFDDDLLVTGDEPIALASESGEPGDAAVGVGTASEIVFPTDPRHALVLVRPDLTQREMSRRGTPEMARVINRNIAYGSHRWVIHRPGTNPLDGLDVPAKGAAVRTKGKHVVVHLRPPRAKR